MIRICTVIFLTVSLFVLNACAYSASQAKKVEVARPLPSKCGNYDLVYGSVDKYGIFKKLDGTRINILGLDASMYSGKKILLSGKIWYQRGGLLNSDGSDAHFSVDNLLEAKIIQVVDGGFDYGLIEKRCNALKEQK